MISDGKKTETGLTEAIWIAHPARSFHTRCKRLFGYPYELFYFSRLTQMFEALEEARRARQRDPLLLVTDVTFPDGNLLEWLQGPDRALPPFIVVSTCNTLQVIDSCLAAGARDYFTQPVDPNLLKVKVERLLGNLRNVPARVSRAPTGLQLDPFQLRASVGDGRRLKLTLKEFQVLKILHEAYPDGISREELYRQVWFDIKVVPKTLDAHLFNLRRKIEELGYEIHFGAGRYALVRLSSEHGEPAGG